MRGAKRATEQRGPRQMPQETGQCQGTRFPQRGPDHLFHRDLEKASENPMLSLDLVSRVLLVPSKLTRPGVPRGTSTCKVVYSFLQRMTTKLRFISFNFPLC